MAIYVLTNVLWLLGGTEMEEEGSLEAGVTIEARDANAAGLTQAETWGGGRGKACRKEEEEEGGDEQEEEEDNEETNCF